MTKKELLIKANNTKTIKVLYKAPNQEPVVRVIPNVQRLKKFIVKYDLDVREYGDIYVICRNEENMRGFDINIVFNFSHIAGDLILINIDKDKRELKSLDDFTISWYTSDLNNKSFKPLKITQKPRKKKHNKKHLDMEFAGREMSENGSATDFEIALIRVMVNIELMLANLINQKGDSKNEQE